MYQMSSTTATPSVAVVFERKEYDVTSLCDKFCPPFLIPCKCVLSPALQQPRQPVHVDVQERVRPCACLRSFLNEEHLVLEPEEAVMTRKTMCDTTVQRRPYGELGSVDKGTAFGCCTSVTSGLGPISPGWGCEEALVDELVEELKARMKTRGDTGQIKRAEQQLDAITQVQLDIKQLNTKLDVIMAHLQIKSPPPSPPASPVVMERDD